MSGRIAGLANCGIPAVVRSTRLWAKAVCSGVQLGSKPVGIGSVG